MEDGFRYLSPSEFRRLRQTEKDSYLAALFKHLHAFLPSERGATRFRSVGDDSIPTVPPRGSLRRRARR